MVADEPAGVDLVVDAGGSGTRAGLSRSGEIFARAEGPSCNPATVGAQRALGNLGELLVQLWSRRSTTTPAIRTAWLALAAGSTPRALARFAAALMTHPTTRVVLAHADRCWLTNDIVPLIVSGKAHRSRIAVVCGTGTGFAARGPAHRYARASGREYLLSDEGGGFDIGLRGLRAVVKASDGRGAPTILQRLLPAWGCASRDELDERVYETAEPKRVIASFAPLVLQAAQGDQASQAIVASAADELLCGITAVCAAAAIPTDADGELVLAGSLLAARESVLRAAVVGRAAQRFPSFDLLDAGDPLTVLAAAASSPTIDPTRLAIRRPSQPSHSSPQRRHRRACAAGGVSVPACNATTPARPATRPGHAADEDRRSVPLRPRPARRRPAPGARPYRRPPRARP